MAQFTSGFDYGTGQLTAGLQGDALAGGGGGYGAPDAGGVVNAILAERRRQEQRQAMLAMQERNRQAIAEGAARQRATLDRNRQAASQYGSSPMDRFREYRKMFEDESAAQHAVKAGAGLQGSAYGAYGSGMAALAAAGIPIAQVKTLSDLQGGGGAEEAASENLRTQQATKSAENEGFANRQARALSDMRLRSDFTTPQRYSYQK